MRYDTNSESLDPADLRPLSPNSAPHIQPTPLVANDTYASTYAHNNNIHIKIASLNCNNPYKSSRPEKRRKIITTFKDASFDLVAVQETSTTSPESIGILTQQFQSTSSLWTSRVGLISMNHDIHLTQIDLPNNLDDRLLLAQVRRSSDLFTPFYVLNLYAIAQHDQTQTHFYE